MTDQALRSKPSVAQPIGDVKTFPPRANGHVKRPESHADQKDWRPTDYREAEQLSDVMYLAFVLVEACKLIVKLIGKRWPGIGQFPVRDHIGGRY